MNKRFKLFTFMNHFQSCSTRGSAGVHYRTSTFFIVYEMYDNDLRYNVQDKCLIEESIGIIYNCKANKLLFHIIKTQNLEMSC